jgi:hypothetical protein
MARQVEQKVCSAVHGFWLVDGAGVSGPDRQAYWVWLSGEGWVFVTSV